MAANPFIDTQDLQDYTGRPVSGDAGAEQAVNAACDICRTISEQTFTKVTGETIVLDGSGTDALLLPQRPVTKVAQVSIGDDVVTDWSINTNGVLVRKYTDATQTTKLIWPAGRRNITIRYDHGSQTVPQDVRMVALMIASRLIIQGVALQESQGTESIRYAVASTDLTAGEKMILRKYKVGL